MKGDSFEAGEGLITGPDDKRETGGRSGTRAESCAEK